MRVAQRLIKTAAVALALAATASTYAADTGISGTGSFRPLEARGPLPAESPFSAADLASGQISFVIRWDDATVDTDPDPSRGLYRGSIRTFALRIGDREIALPISDTSIEVSDGGGGRHHREFVRLQASHLIGSYRLSVGWTTLNETTKTGDLRGTAGLLPDDTLPNGDAVAALKPAGRFDRSLYVTLRSESDARSFPIFLQTAAVDIKPMTTPSGAVR